MENQSNILSTFEFLSMSDIPEGFKVIKCRRYNTNSDYLLPTDEKEEIRLNQHYILRHIMHGNYIAPVEEQLQEGIVVLDAGCGSTAEWTVEMASHYPNSTFIGIDINDVVLQSAEIPSNCSFIKANTVLGLPFEDETFDYIFQRCMFASFTPRDWETGIRELARVVKPGGWVESFEPSSSFERSPPDMRIYKAVVSLSEAQGIDLGYVLEIPNLLAANNFEDISSDYVSIPFGWGGRVGELHGRNGLMTWTALAPLVAPVLKISHEECVDLTKAAFANFKANKTWNKGYCVYGRKVSSRKWPVR
ncbi:S-adenosyl-L-methionine-dependent methyltransferase [Jimgerdemannia flammicorona]|uniref:S-adenosyl-L-methionine-dependent methyltransferase n=1 Tax=Jimgerdemannia flammicorona TaxID=994334 RepID=A0A433QQI2_9FUNG|nr:S-adenosyl-L-methionine-dependent methyltransferase [Jimgerdemannia flammicorona]